MRVITVCVTLSCTPVTLSLQLSCLNADQINRIVCSALLLFYLKIIIINYVVCHKLPFFEIHCVFSLEMLSVYDRLSRLLQRYNKHT